MGKQIAWELTVTWNLVEKILTSSVILKIMEKHMGKQIAWELTITWNLVEKILMCSAILKIMWDIVRHTLQHNGVANKMNRTLSKRASCTLLNVGLWKEFWVKTINLTCYIVNGHPIY